MLVLAPWSILVNQINVHFDLQAWKETARERLHYLEAMVICYPLYLTCCFTGSYLFSVQAYCLNFLGLCEPCIVKQLQ